MTTLTTDRIRDHATRLGLTHLTDTITQLVDRAEHAQLRPGHIVLQLARQIGAVAHARLLDGAVAGVGRDGLVLVGHHVLHELLVVGECHV